MTEPAELKGLGRNGKLAVVGLLAALVATAAYVRLGPSAQTPPECRNALETAGSLAPLARGDVAIFRPASASENLTALAFTDADGAPVTLGAFQGRTLLVNFWATWCVPCRTEMPALDRLAAGHAGDGFEVLAVNLDVDGGREKEAAFLRDIGATHLTLYRDPKLTLTSDLKRRGLVFGLPTTLLVNAGGCRLGTAEGAAAWDSADARKLVAAAMAQNGDPPRPAAP